MHSRILILILLFLSLFLATNRTSAVIIDGIAAIVNEDIITQSELYALEQLKLDLSGLPPEPDMLQKRIDHHLALQQMAKQPPVALTEEEVHNALQDYAKRYGSTENLAAFLGSVGMNYTDLEVEIREQMSIHKFITDRFRPFVNITIEDAEKYYNEIYKPLIEDLGRVAPPFEESFNDVQALMVESQVRDKIKDWLMELRRSATINVKGRQQIVSPTGKEDDE